MAVALTPALSQREREIKERAARDFHGKVRTFKISPEVHHEYTEPFQDRTH
jgi:hypothetical protein